MRSQVRSLLSAITLMSAFMIYHAMASAQQPPTPPPDMTIDAATRSSVIDNLVKELNDTYVFLETAKKMETDLRSRQSKNEYDSITSAREFAKKLTEDLQAVSKDKHLRVRFSKDPIPARRERREPTAEEKAADERYLKFTNHGFEKVERMPGNVGYLKFWGFFGADTGAETIASAMNFLSGTDALIIDLRENGGGSPAMVALICSYFFGDQPVHLNDLYWRKENKTEEFWTKPAVAGKKYLGKEIYVLTSSYTFSGAEEFTYNLKNLKRATIIGETTGGGAHPGGMVRLGDHFGAFVPSGRAINPITKTNWEGTGVEPDIKVPKNQALKTAYMLGLRKAIEKATDENIKNTMRGLIEDTQKDLDELKKKYAEEKKAAKAG